MRIDLDGGRAHRRPAHRRGQAGLLGACVRDFFDADRTASASAWPPRTTGGLVGYLLGEVRAFEFGSEACGWIFAVGVETPATCAGCRLGLLAEACRRFARPASRGAHDGARATIPVLSFFRSNGFVGGSFVQLERDLEGR